jgi:hypothetical protein
MVVEEIPIAFGFHMATNTEQHISSFNIVV